MTTESKVLTDDYLGRARELLRQIESGNEEEAGKLLDELTKLRENSLFQELGRLTREFHEALNAFRFDSRIAAALTETDFPDARERLKYVITMTAQSADRTLTAVEESMPLCDEMEADTLELKGQWERFTRRELTADEFRILVPRLEAYFGRVSEDIPKLRGNLQEVLMAQDFQDLTGQIIRRVINLVDDVEENLVELIRISGQNLLPKEKSEKPESAPSGIEASGPPVPGVDTGTVSGQDEVDDLLSSLGF